MLIADAVHLAVWRWQCNAFAVMLCASFGTSPPTAYLPHKQWLPLSAFKLPLLSRSYMWPLIMLQ